MNKIWDIYTYGDVNIDLVVPNVNRFPPFGTEDEVDTMETFVGGGAALFTMGAAKLGMKTVFQGSVGDDMYGRAIRNNFSALGIDLSLLATESVRKTGISISFTNASDRCFLTYRGTNEGLSLSKLNFDQAKKARHIHVTSYMGRQNHAEYLSVMKRIKAESDTTISLDTGWDPTEEWFEGIVELLPYVDVLLMNETECLHYTRADNVDDGVKKLSAAGRTVIKLGQNGSVSYQNGVKSFAESFHVKAVDTTGAGDSFNAGYLSAWLRGYDAQKCLTVGNACGALSVTKLGGNTGFPTKVELEAFLAKHQGGNT